MNLCRGRLALLVFAGTCALLAVAVYAVALDTRQGLTWDARALEAATAQRDVPAVRAASSRLIDTIDIGSLVLLGGGMVAVALLLRRPRAALGAALVIAGANATTQALKPVLGALHPFGKRAELGSSFPSGHATVAMSLALAAVLVAPAGWKLVVAIAGAAYAAGVGISLLVQAAHYPSDVAGAYLVAAVWGAAVAALLPDDPEEATREAIRAGLVAVGVAVTAFGVAVAVAVHRHPGIVLRVELQTKLVVALAVLAALALAVAAGLALLLQATALRSASTTRS